VDSGPVPSEKSPVRNIFVVPGSHEAPSGGNIYNLCLVDSLKKKGVNVESETPARAAVSRHPEEKRTYWVDTLCIGYIDELLSIKEKYEDVFLIIHHLQSLEPGLSREERIRECAKEKKVFDAVSGFLVTSPFTREVLRQRGVSAKPVFVVPPAPSIFPSSKKKAIREFSGLMVANLIPRKGILEFLEAMGRRVTRKDDFRIRIAGRFDIDLEYSRRCLDAVQRNPILSASVIFSGPLPLNRMKREYENANVFISASKMETYGMALQEAREFGLPILTLEAGYAGVHVDPGRNGWLCKSIGELSDACLSFIREPERLCRLREKIRIPSGRTRYSWDDAADRFIDQYREYRG